MSDQQVKNIAIALKDVDPKVITAIASFSTNQEPSRVRKTVTSVLRSSKQAKLSARDIQEVSTLLSTSFAHFKEEEWDIEKELGKGAYGVVSLMKSKASSKKIATKKFINRNGINHDVVREVGCYSLLIATRSPMYLDIVQGVVFEPSKISIALRLANGTLYEYAMNINQKRRIEVFGNVYNLATNCLAYLHACDIIHADIKTRNMLAWWNTDLEITELVIADFGLASSRPDRIAYTPGFKAPEILDNEHEDAPFPDKTTDIWALGMSLIEFLTKNTWAYTYEEDAIPWKIVDQTGYHDQILSMLNHTPSERLKLDEPILTFPERDWITINPLMTTFDYRELFERYSIMKVSTATFVQAVDIFWRYYHLSDSDIDPQEYLSAALIIASKWGEEKIIQYSFFGIPIKQLQKIEREILETLNGLVFIPGLEGLISNLENIPQRFRKNVWKQFIPDPIAFNEVVRNYPTWKAILGVSIKFVQLNKLTSFASYTR